MANNFTAIVYTSDGQLAARGSIYSGPPAKSQVYFEKS
jgi:hypothetical protein